MGAVDLSASHVPLSAQDADLIQGLVTQAKEGDHVQIDRCEAKVKVVDSNDSVIGYVKGEDVTGKEGTVKSVSAVFALVEITSGPLPIMQESKQMREGDCLRVP